MVWTHYQVRHGLPAPFTKQAADKTRPEGTIFTATIPALAPSRCLMDKRHPRGLSMQAVCDSCFSPMTGITNSPMNLLKSLEIVAGGKPQGSSSPIRGSMSALSGGLETTTSSSRPGTELRQQSTRCRAWPAAQLTTPRGIALGPLRWLQSWQAPRTAGRKEPRHPASDAHAADREGVRTNSEPSGPLQGWLGIGTW